MTLATTAITVYHSPDQTPLNGTHDEPLICAYPFTAGAWYCILCRRQVPAHVFRFWPGRRWARRMGFHGPCCPHCAEGVDIGRP